MVRRGHRRPAPRLEAGPTLQAEADGGPKIATDAAAAESAPVPACRRGGQHDPNVAEVAHTPDQVRQSAAGGQLQDPWKQSSASWDAPADVSETTRGPSRQRPVSHFLDGLTPGVEYNIRVIATDSVGDREPSNEITYMKPASAQQSLSNTPAEGDPRIDGSPEVGQTLSADTTAIADADGLDNAVFQYQWLASDADIPGATGATYTVVSGDVGKAIRVRVTFTDDAGHEETLTSAPTVVTAGLQLQSATVDGATLTLTYNKVLDTGVRLGTARSP